MSLINNLFLLFCKMNVKSTVCNKRVQLRVKLKSLRVEVCCCVRPCVTLSVWDYIRGPRALVSHCALDYISASILFLPFSGFPFRAIKTAHTLVRVRFIWKSWSLIRISLTSGFTVSFAPILFPPFVAGASIELHYSPNCTRVTGLQVLWPKRRCRSRQRNR